MSEIANYTLDQVKFFCVAIEKEERERLKLELTVTSIGSQGTGEAVKDLMNELDGKRKYNPIPEEWITKEK